MPLLWLYLLLLVPAVPLAYDDFRMRQVALVWLAVLGTGCFGVMWVVSGIGTTLSCFVANMCLLAGFAVAMALYQLACRRPFRDFFICSFGAGDAVMMAAVAPLFGPAAYVRFLLAATLVALGWWAVRRPATVPLAGFMALTLSVYVVFKTAGLWN